MFERFKTLLGAKSKLKPYFSLGSLGMYVVVVVTLSVAWASVKVIQRNYLLLKQIAVLEQQVDIENQKVENQKLINEYYKTNTYLEIAARRELNKALPGEKLLIVPKEVALSKLPVVAKVTKAIATKPVTSNWQAWLDFLSGRASRQTD